MLKPRSETEINQWTNSIGSTPFLSREGLLTVTSLSAADGTSEAPSTTGCRNRTKPPGGRAAPKRQAARPWLSDVAAGARVLLLALLPATFRIQHAQFLQASLGARKLIEVSVSRFQRDLKLVDRRWNAA